MENFYLLLDSRTIIRAMVSVPNTQQSIKCLLFNWQVSVSIGSLTLCHHALHGPRQHRPCCEGILSLIRDIGACSSHGGSSPTQVTYSFSKYLFLPILFYVRNWAGHWGCRDDQVPWGLWLPGALSAVGEMYVKQSHQRLSCVMTAAKKTPGFCGWLGRWQFG